MDARSQYVVLRQGEKWEKYVWNAATLKVKRPEMNERVNVQGPRKIKLKCISKKRDMRM